MHTVLVWSAHALLLVTTLILLVMGVAFLLSFSRAVRKRYAVKKALKANKQTLSSLPPITTQSNEVIAQTNPPAPLDTVQQRLAKAAEITRMQVKVVPALPVPMNGVQLHSFNNLELEKLQILNTILLDGYDPIITIHNMRGNDMQMPLSEYIAQIKKTLH